MLLNQSQNLITRAEHIMKIKPGFFVIETVWIILVWGNFNVNNLIYIYWKIKWLYDMIEIKMSSYIIWKKEILLKFELQQKDKWNMLVICDVVSYFLLLWRKIKGCRKWHTFFLFFIKLASLESCAFPGARLPHNLKAILA